MKPSANLPFFVLLFNLCSLEFLTQVSSEKILVLTFYSSKSNKITYWSLLEELAARGHQITFISCIKPFKAVPNITEILTYDVYGDPIMRNTFNAFQMKKNKEDTNPFVKTDFFRTICDKTYQLPHIQEFINSRPKFDLIFLQSTFNDCVLGLVHKLNAPFILFSPTNVPSFNVEKLGGYLPPSFVPHITATFLPEMSFTERLVNFWFQIYCKVMLDFIVQPAMAEIYRHHLKDPTLPSVPEILANASLILSNGHFSMFGGRPYLPNVIEIGGIHSKPPKPLPKELEDFIEQGGDSGFIFFSLGSIIDVNLMPEDQRKILMNVFSKLNAQVLVKWANETMPNLPKNVKLSKWLPQQDVLGHPKIKLFITHCGGGGLEESVFHGVPIIGMPFWGDQFLNVETAKRLGFGLEFDWNELTEENLASVINEALSNPKYYTNAKQLSAVFRDNPLPPLEKGVYWVEYVMRHKGAPQLQSASVKLNFVQYHSLDVLAVYLLFILGILYTLKCIVAFAFTKFFARKTNANVKRNKKFE